MLHLKELSPVERSLKQPYPLGLFGDWYSLNAFKAP